MTLDPDAAVDADIAEPVPKQKVTDEAAQAASAAATAVDTTSAANTPARPVRDRRAPRGFVLRSIAMPTSAYLSEDEIATVEASLAGRRVINADVVAQAINAAYAAKGIRTAQARVRSVDRRRGIVEVDLLEARVGRVRTEGLLSERYLRYRLGLSEGTLADNRVIEKRLLRLRLTDGLPVQLGFAPGSTIGMADVILAQPSAKRHQTSVTVNNYGPPSEGEEQLVLSHVIRSLTGWNDSLSVSATMREGGKSVFLSYSRVVTPGGGSIGMSASYSQTETIRPPRFNGEEREFSLSYTQPVIVEENRRLSFTGALAAFREKGDLLGVRSLDQQGHELSLGAAYFQRGQGWSLSIAPRLAYGSYSNRVLGGGDIDYTTAQVSAFVSHALGPALVGSVTLNAQRVLIGTAPSQRQFTITSSSGVRGYPASLSSGESGYYVRTQIERATPYTLDPWALRPFVFVDVGEGWDSTDTALGLASSVGLGLSFGIGQRLFGDLYIARPLTTNITGWAGRSDDPAIGVSLSTSF